MILDIATVKRDLIPIFERLDAEGMSVCSTHPMVSATSPTTGQNVLIMPIGTNAADAKGAAEMLFASLEMNLTEVAIENHGEWMAIVQGMPHLVQRVVSMVLSKTLESSGLTIGQLSRIGSANYVFSEWALGRTLALKPEISSDIVVDMLQTETGERMAAALRASIDKVLTAAQRGELHNLFANSAARLDPGGDWTQDMKRETDKLMALHAKSCESSPNRNDVLG